MTIEESMKNLFLQCGLGEIDRPPIAVSGGYMHKMFKVHACDRFYAVKYLNPSVMSRETAAANFDRAEKLEKVLEDAGIPIVPALLINGRKRQCVGKDSFYIFEWKNGAVTDWNSITEKQCYEAGSVLGRIHSLKCDVTKKDETESSCVPWQRYAKEAADRESPIKELLADNLQFLAYAEQELNQARKKLPSIVCISDGDMDPKNVMWENGSPLVIDLECLDYGNPVSDVLQLALQWSGIVGCNLDLNRTEAFFRGYFTSYDNGFREYDSVFGLVYSWIEWLAYNIERALRDDTEEAERAIGISEVKNTISRIRYLYEKEQEIRQMLKQL